MRYILLFLPALFFFLAAWTLRAYWRAWRGGVDVSRQVPAGGLAVSADTADRCALPIGLMWFAMALILVCSPWATSKGEKIPNGALDVAIVGVALEAFAAVLFACVYLFNRPRFLAPPRVRNAPGRWTRSRLGA